MSGPESERSDRSDHHGGDGMRLPCRFLVAPQLKGANEQVGFAIDDEGKDGQAVHR